jgi:hypothetical protein
VRNNIVEGEPGIFPDPISRLLVRLGRLGRRKRADPGPPPPPEQPAVGADEQPGTTEPGAPDRPQEH